MVSPTGQAWGKQTAHDPTLSRSSGIIILVATSCGGGERWHTSFFTGCCPLKFLKTCAILIHWAGHCKRAHCKRAIKNRTCH